MSRPTSPRSAAQRSPSQRKDAARSEPRERSLYDSRMIEDLSRVRTAALQIEVFRNQTLAFDVNAMEMPSPRALRPFRTTPGYFMVRREPMLQSIHLISASSMASPRLVTRL